MKKTELTKIIKDYGKFRIEAETLEDLESYETNLINVLNEAINYTHSCESDSEQLIAFAEWKEYNGKWETHKQQVKNFLKEYKSN